MDRLEWVYATRPFSEGDGAPVAQKIEVLLVDDLDGGEAEATVPFSAWMALSTRST